MGVCCPESGSTTIVPSGPKTLPSPPPIPFTTSRATTTTARTTHQPTTSAQKIETSTTKPPANRKGFINLFNTLIISGTILLIDSN